MMVMYALENYANKLPTYMYFCGSLGLWWDDPLPAVHVTYHSGTDAVQWPHDNRVSTGRYKSIFYHIQVRSLEMQVINLFIVENHASVL